MSSPRCWAKAADGLPLIDEAPAIRQLRETLREIADMDVDVLVEGEPGTGKEVVAELLHRWTHRRSKAFVARYCGALPETVIESELFGHEAGALPGRSVGVSAASSIPVAERSSSTRSNPCRPRSSCSGVLETRSVTPLGSNLSRKIWQKITLIEDASQR